MFYTFLMIISIPTVLDDWSSKHESLCKTCVKNCIEYIEVPSVTQQTSDSFPLSTGFATVKTLSLALWEGMAKKNGTISEWNSVLLDLSKYLVHFWCACRSPKSPSLLHLSKNFFRLVTWSKHIASSIGNGFSPKCLIQASTLFQAGGSLRSIHTKEENSSMGSIHFSRYSKHELYRPCTWVLKSVAFVPIAPSL